MRDGSGIEASPRERERALDRSAARRTFGMAAGLLAANAIVNATTILLEAARNGAPLDGRLPFVEEISSCVVLALLFPFVARLVEAVPIRAETWRWAVPLHGAASVVFSALHVVGMVFLREITFPVILDRSYELFDAPLRVAVYEYRKDALAYATFLLVLHLTRDIVERGRDLATARADARRSGRITLKCGGRTIWLAAGTIEWVEAAGNYVDVRAGGAMHLARTSLSALEGTLREAGLPMVRIHRSHLVNRDKVADVLPTGNGDFLVRLIDGSEIRGSRRYRGNLPA